MDIKLISSLSVGKPVPIKISDNSVMIFMVCKRSMKNIKITQEQIKNKFIKVYISQKL